jgi:hypothetical protein
MKKIMQLLAILIFNIFFMSCNRDENKSSAKDIIGFALSSQVGETQIDKTGHKVFAEVSFESDLSKLVPELILSDGATSAPKSGDTVDFSSEPVKYIITAEDGSTLEWDVTVGFEKSNAAEILSFSVENQKGETIIGNDSVIVVVKTKVNLDSISPEIIVSPGATVSPASGVITDFSAGPVIYTVTSSDGTTKEWIVSITKEPNVENFILTFSIPGQVGETVITSSNVTIEMPYGTDLSSLTPAITISEKATIAPGIGEAVDFSSGKTVYNVTSEAGYSRKYTVYVNYALIAADNTNIQYTGRIDFTNPKEPVFWAPGVYIKAKYKGTSCVVALNDEMLWGNSKNYIELVIDDTILQRVQTTGSVNNIVVGENLPYGEHTILVCKNTESSIGYLKFLGFRCEELLPLPEKPIRKMEFIGNSITCGTGSDLSEIACDVNQWYDQHNAYLSYGPRTARNLNAQWHLSSVSGIGMIHSCCDMTVVIKDVFGCIGLNQNNKAWNFENYIPDVVTISLGQNDGVQDSTAFCSAYVSFIKTIRGHYPNADIICLTSPMADDYLLGYMKKYINGIVNQLNTEGDNKVHKFFFSRSFNNGCGGHPDIDDHKLIADELTAYLQSELGW